MVLGVSAAARANSARAGKDLGDWPPAKFRFLLGFARVIDTMAGPGPEKQILILTADVGFGHRSAANAIMAAIREHYKARCQVEIINPLDDKRTPAFLRDTQTDYDRLVRRMPESYKLSYQLTNEPVPSAIVDQALTVLLFGTLRDLLKHRNPDVIVVTNATYLAPLKAVLALHRRSIPFVTVITDLTRVHRQWFKDGAEGLFVPTEQVYQQAIEAGFHRRQVHITGIPINPAISAEGRSKEAIRTELGWIAGKTTLLVVGSKRVKNLERVLHLLNHSGFDIQMAIVAGGDDRFYERMQQAEWHWPVYLYNFVEQMPTLLRAADAILSKAGGLIVSESLACGLPMLFADVTPGQEEGNADYVVQNGAGELAPTPAEVLECLCHWLEADGKLLRQHAMASLRLGKPDAAHEIADLTWRIAESGRSERPLMSAQALSRLKALLARFGIPFGEDGNASADENKSSDQQERPKTLDSHQN